MSSTLSKKQIRDILWSRGDLKWYLKKYQRQAYDLFKSNRFAFFEKSRRIGGTTAGLVFVQEFLRKNPGSVWRWCEPWKYQAREIVMPEMNLIQDSCPKKLRFTFYRTDSFYEFPLNGSRLYLRGVNEDKGESSRGAFAHGITCDEFGSWKEADYIVNDVLIPQLLSTNGSLFKISSPPKDLGHVYYTDRERAVRENRFLCLDVQASVPDLYSDSQISEMREAVGGEGSITWRREFLCEHVADPESLIVPEFTDANVVEDDYPRPEWPTYYVAGDSGFDDNTALLFFWYDFIKNEVVFEEEIVVAGKTTKAIIDLAKAKEVELWAGAKPHRRVYDANKQSIFDIYADHKYPVYVPPKDDKHAAIHEFRLETQALRIKVKKRCKNLIRQLKVGMWKDEKHLDFSRTEGLGHLDAIAAAVYGIRVVDRKLNPVPPHYGLSFVTHHIPPTSVEGTSEGNLLSAFGVK